MKTERKLIFILPNLRTGGAQKTFIRLANIFKKEGNLIEIIVLGSPSNLYKDINKNIKCTFFYKKKIKYAFSQLYLYLNREKPYAIITCLNYMNVMATIVTKIASPNSKIIISERGIFSKEVNNKSFYSLIIKFLSFVTYRIANEIIAVSRGVALDLSETLKIPLNKIKVIYNPTISESLIKQSQEKIPAKYEKYFKKPTIVSIGRLEHVKGYDILIKAFSKVKNIIDCSLIIIGEGSLRKELIELCKSLNIENSVFLPGIISNPYPFVRRSKIFVLPSRSEGLPNALIEALGIGKTLIATDCEGAKEIISSRKIGYIIDNEDYRGMSEVILEVLVNKKYIDPRSIEKLFAENIIYQKYYNLIYKNKKL